MATKKKTFGASKKKAVKPAKKAVKKKAVRKAVKKTATKRPTVKVVKKTVVKKTAVSKTVKKQMASTKKSATKANAKNVKQDVEIAKLKEEVAKLQGKGKKAKGKKKVNSKRISEYNLFIRKQIKSGYTFTRAVREWNKYQALMSKDKRRPSAYNQFIGSQMRLGKTFQQAVALWKLAKAGTLGKKGKTRTITKTKYKTRTVKSKPEIKYRTRTKTVEAKPKIVYRTKKVEAKPTIVYRTRKVNVPVQSKTKIVQKEIDYAKLGQLMARAVSSTKTSISKTDIKEVVEADEEEVAFKIVQTYFKEIARFGFKKRLTLDEIINAYLYSLARVKREEYKHVAVAEAVRKSGMRK